MKQSLLLIFTIGIASIFQAPEDGDQILGQWENEQRNSKIEFIKQENTYSAKLVWMDQPNDPDGKPKLDINNPDPTKRGQRLVGSVIITDLKFAGDKWTNGKIYLPKRGIYAKCQITQSEENMHLTVSKGLFSDTKIWTKVL